MRNAGRNGDEGRSIAGHLDRHASSEALLFAPDIRQSDRAVTIHDDDIVPAQTVNVDAPQHVRVGPDEIPLNRPRRQIPFIAMDFDKCAPRILD